MIKSLHAFSQILSTREPSIALIMAADREDQKKALKFFQKTPPFIFINSSTFSATEFLEESEQLDLFVKKKCMVIEEAQLLKKEAISLLFSYLEKPNPYFTLILLASELLSASKIVQKIDNEGVVLNLLEEKVWDKKARLVHELLHFLQQEGISMEAKLCAQWVESQGCDQSVIQQELDKLICFIGERREIIAGDIAAISLPLFHQTIWNLVDAIFQRDSMEAIFIGTQLLTESSIFYLLAILRTQIRVAMEMLILYEREGKEGVTKRYAYLKGGLLEKKISLLKGYGLSALQKSSLILFEAECQARESHLEEKVILEMLLVRLCR